MNTLERWIDPRDGKTKYLRVREMPAPSIGSPSPAGQWLAKLDELGLEPIVEPVLTGGTRDLGIMARQAMRSEGLYWGHGRPICRWSPDGVRCWPSRAAASRETGLHRCTIFTRVRHGIVESDGSVWFYPDDLEGFDDFDDFDAAREGWSPDDQPKGA